MPHLNDLIGNVQGNSQDPAATLLAGIADKIEQHRLDPTALLELATELRAEAGNGNLAKTLQQSPADLR